MLRGLEPPVDGSGFYGVFLKISLKSAENRRNPPR